MASAAHCIAWGAGKNSKTVITTKRHLNVTSSRKPKTHFECTRLFAHTPLHTRTLTQTQTHNGTATQLALCFAQAETFGGLLEVAGREEEVHYRSLAWCHALCCIQWQCSAGSGFRCGCHMHPTNTATRRRLLHIGAVDACVLVLLALQLLG